MSEADAEDVILEEGVGDVQRPRLVLATTNAGKVREVAAILRDVPIALRVPTQLGRGPAPVVEEDSETFLGNALKKARVVAQWAQMAALADDSGLEVDALEGAPGIHSARYAGVHATDEDNITKLLAALHGLAPERRTARFRCAAVLVDVSGEHWYAEATWEGRIVESPRGDGGFGYDSVFVPEGWSSTSAEVPACVKDESSHRGRAFRQLLPAVEAWAAMVQAADF